MSASKFTPETRGALIQRAAAGVSLPDACRALGLRVGTAKAWLTRGRRAEDGPYADFAEAIDAARAQAEALPEPMDEAEFRLRVSTMVRQGSVQAARLYWEILKEDRKRASEAQKPEPGSLKALDELAARRATKLAGQ